MQQSKNVIFPRVFPPLSYRAAPSVRASIDEGFGLPLYVKDLLRTARGRGSKEWSDVVIGTPEHERNRAFMFDEHLDFSDPSVLGRIESLVAASEPVTVPALPYLTRAAYETLLDPKKLQAAKALFVQMTDAGLSINTSVAESCFDAAFSGGRTWMEDCLHAVEGETPRSAPTFQRALRNTRDVMLGFRMGGIPDRGGESVSSLGMNVSSQLESTRFSVAVPLQHPESGVGMFCDIKKASISLTTLPAPRSYQVVPTKYDDYVLAHIFLQNIAAVLSGTETDEAAVSPETWILTGHMIAALMLAKSAEALVAVGFLGTALTLGLAFDQGWMGVLPMGYELAGMGHRAFYDVADNPNLTPRVFSSQQIPLENTAPVSLNYACGVHMQINGLKTSFEPAMQLVPIPLGIWLHSNRLVDIQVAKY